MVFPGRTALPRRSRIRPADAVGNEQAPSGGDTTCEPTCLVSNRSSHARQRPRRTAPSHQARQHLQRRVRAGAAVAGEPRSQSTGTRGRQHQRQAPELFQTQFPDLRLWRGQHPPRLQHGQCSRRAGGRLLRSVEGVGARPAARTGTGRPAKEEFILDVQGHFIDTPKGNAKNADVFLKDVFMDSDTDVMVLSFVPSSRTRRAGDDPGRRPGAPARRQARRHAPAAAAWARQSQPGR